MSVQNIQKTGDEKSVFSVFDLYDDGEHLWFTAIEYNALFMMDSKSFDIVYIGSFPDEEIYGIRLYTTINEKNGKLYFTPCSAHEIGVYDMKNKRFEKIDIGIPRCDNDVSKVKYGKKFVSAYIYDNILILIPCCYEFTIIYDIKSGTVLTNSDMYRYFYRKYSKYSSSSDLQFYLCWFSRKLDSSIVVFNLQSNLNIIVFYDLQNGTFTEQMVGQNQSTFGMIEYDGEYLWLYDERMDILVRGRQADEAFMEIHLPNQIKEFKKCGLNHSFVNMAIWGEWLYLIPAYSNFVLKVNTKTTEVAVIDQLSSECYVQNDGIAYSNLCKVSGEKLYLFGNRSKRLIECKDSSGIRLIKIKFSENVRYILEQNYLMDAIRNYHNLFVEEHISLINYLYAVRHLSAEPASLNEEERKPITEAVGYKIYNRFI